MTDELEDLKRRLVLGHKSDGRSVYDEAAKSELVALCRQPGASVSCLARECGVNANQVSRWLREHDQGSRVRKTVAGMVCAPAAFVAVALPPSLPPQPIRTQERNDDVVAVDLQARLPNGGAIDLHGVELRHVGEVIEALGRLRCSASTKAWRSTCTASRWTSA